LPWITQAAASKKPFFAWLNFGSAHWPYGQSEPNHFSSSTYEGYLHNVSFDTWNLVSYEYKNQVYGRYVAGEHLRPVLDLHKEDFDYLIGRYDDGIVMTDRRLGQLLDFLAASGLDKNTVVILQSEHGEGLNERGYVMHYDIYDEQTHMPLIIKTPLLAPQQVSALASGVDVLPTLLSILNLPKTPTDGVDFTPYLLHKSDPPRQEVYITRTALWERVMSSMQYEGLDGFYALDNKMHFADTAIRTLDWKLIHRRSREAMKKWSWFNHLLTTPMESPEYELYYLPNYPKELHDVYEQDKTNPSVIYLVEKLNDWEQAQFGTTQPETTKEETQPYF
jgi:arylsulfatase A-like enzyme